MELCLLPACPKKHKNVSARSNCEQKDLCVSLAAAVMIIKTFWNSQFYLVDYSSCHE